MIKLKSYQIVTISGWISRVIQAILQIYIINLLTTFLNIDNYAMYTLLAALLGWLALSDFGLNISLQNYISECRSKNINYKNYIQTATFLIIVAFVCLSILIYPLSYFIAPMYLEQFSISKDEKVFLVYITCMMFLTTVISSIIYKIFYALHKGYISNIAPAIGTIITFIFLYMIIASKEHFEQYSLLYSLIVSFSPQFIIPLILIIIFLFKQKIYPKFNYQIAINLIKRASRFWGFAIMGSFVLQIDYIIASKYLLPNDIVLYNTLSKIYLFILVIYGSLLSALWPVITEHLSKNEHGYIKNYLKTYIPAGFILVVIFSIFIYFFSSNIFSFLVKNTILHANILIIVLFASYYLVRVWTDTFATILQSASILKPLWKIVPFQAFISIISQIVLASKFGIYGILLGLLLSYLLTVSWYLPIISKKRIFKR